MNQVPWGTASWAQGHPEIWQFLSQGMVINVTIMIYVDLSNVNEETFKMQTIHDFNLQVEVENLQQTKTTIWMVLLTC